MKLDERWGIRWWAKMLARRLRPRELAHFTRGCLRDATHERPIFVVGVPRSGTSSLKRLLAASPELCAPPFESHLVWLAFHHPRRSGWESAAVGSGEVRFGERRFVNAFFYAYCSTSRFVDKAPANSLRIPHLLEVFPDAFIVVIRRDPCDVINSLINGWREPSGRFRSYYVPEDLRIPTYPHKRQWRFALIPGWRDCIGRPVHEIAFAQWDRISTALDDARSFVPSSRWVDLHLEELRSDPTTELARLCRGVDIAPDPQLERELERLLERPANAMSPPSVSKWREQNSRDIRELLPRIAAAAPARGYRVDPATGDFEVRRVQTPSSGAVAG